MPSRYSNSQVFNVCSDMILCNLWLWHVVISASFAFLSSWRLYHVFLNVSKILLSTQFTFSDLTSVNLRHWTSVNLRHWVQYVARGVASSNPCSWFHASNRSENLVVHCMVVYFIQYVTGNSFIHNTLQLRSVCQAGRLAFCNF